MACKCCTNSLSECLKDLKDTKLWRGILAEGIGTMLLVFIGCGACLNNEWETFSPTQVQISLTFGLAVATIVWMIAHISGGHINPAVTVALLVTRKITLVRALLFIAVQCAGAIAGAALLMGVTPKDGRASLGLTSINEHLEVEQAFAVETIITFVLVFTVFSSIDSNRKDLGGSAPLAIGLSVALCHLFAIKYTGSSMNPARSFGPAVVTWVWENHWIYWSGPIAGGVLAGVLYETVFAENSTLKKAKYFVLSSKYDSTYDFHQRRRSETDIEEAAKMAERGDHYGGQNPCTGV